MGLREIYSSVVTDAVQEQTNMHCGVEPLQEHVLYSVDRTGPTGTCIQVLIGHTAQVLSITQLCPGQVISGSQDKSLRIWDVARGTCIRELWGHNGWVRCVGARIVVLKYDGYFTIT